VISVRSPPRSDYPGENAPPEQGSTEVPHGRRPGAQAGYFWLSDFRRSARLARPAAVITAAVETVSAHPPAEFLAGFRTDPSGLAAKPRATTPGAKPNFAEHPATSTANFEALRGGRQEGAASTVGALFAGVSGQQKGTAVEAAPLAVPLSRDLLSVTPRARARTWRGLPKTGQSGQSFSKTAQNGYFWAVE
jgi:hypothetical protein